MDFRLTEEQRALQAAAKDARVILAVQDDAIYLEA